LVFHSSTSTIYVYEFSLVPSKGSSLTAGATSEFVCTKFNGEEHC